MSFSGEMDENGKNASDSLTEVIDQFDIKKKGGLTKENFIELLKALKYPGTKSKMGYLYENLLKQGNDGTISIDAESLFGKESILGLYSHGSYSYGRIRTFDHTRKKLELVTGVFNKYDANNTQYIGPKDSGIMLKECANLFGIHMSEETRAFFNQHSHSESGLSLSEFINGVLRFQGLDNLRNNIEELDIFPNEFRKELLSPQLTSPENFISWLDEYAMNHTAVNHHLLHSISRGAYGDNHIRILYRYLKCYQIFSKHFATYVKNCRNFTKILSGKTF